MISLQYLTCVMEFWMTGWFTRLFLVFAYESVRHPVGVTHRNARLFAFLFISSFCFSRKYLPGYLPAIFCF